MEETLKTKIKILFVARVCLYIVALGSTIYWISYSAKLHANGIYAPEEYSPLMRPVLYSCLGITIAAICICCVLHNISVRLKKKMDEELKDL